MGSGDEPQAWRQVSSALSHFAGSKSVNKCCFMLDGFMHRIKLIPLGVNFEVGTFVIYRFKNRIHRTNLKKSNYERVYGSLFRMEQSHTS